MQSADDQGPQWLRATSIPLFLIHDGYLDGHIMLPREARKHWVLDKDGYATLPQGPGLGVEMNETLIPKVDTDPKRRFPWPVPQSPDGSVRDY